MSVGTDQHTDPHQLPAETEAATQASLQRYDAVLKDELELQAAQYPTKNELPGCMGLM